MKIALIGSGNVATHLAQALKTAGLDLTQIWSRRLENAEQLAKKTGARWISSLEELDNDIELVIVAVKDDAVASIVDQLAAFNGTVVHTSGAVSMEVFQSKVAHYGVLYPLQTFSLKKEVDFSTIPICIEASDAKTLLSIRQLAEQLSKNVTEVDSARRSILHLAAVFACNFPNHLYALAADLLRQYELDFDLIRPLILETAVKVQQALPAEVQTGPAVRNDELTLQRHEALLANDPHLVDIYKLLSDSIKKSSK